jgi:hypothetical protein
LERSKEKVPIVIRALHEIDRSITQAADAVEKEYVLFAHQSFRVSAFIVWADQILHLCSSYRSNRFSDAGNGYGLQPSAPSAKRSK